MIIGSISLILGILLQGGIRIISHYGLLEAGLVVIITNGLLLVSFVLLLCMDLILLGAPVTNDSLTRLVICSKTAIMPFYMVQLVSHVASNFKFYLQIKR
jgi:hypothetical protein